MGGQDTRAARVPPARAAGAASAPSRRGRPGSPGRPGAAGAALGRGDTFWGDGTVQYPDHSDGFTAHTDVRILHVVQFKYVLSTVNELHVNVAEKKTLTRHTL